jgi:hypothetical protein
MQAAGGRGASLRYWRGCVVCDGIAIVIIAISIAQSFTTVAAFGVVDCGGGRLLVVGLIIN